MKDITRRSLIGETVKVVAASNATLVGLCGTIIDESKHMLTIETTHGKKQVVKDQVTLQIKGTRVPGASLTKRIEERIKG